MDQSNKMSPRRAVLQSGLGLLAAGTALATGQARAATVAQEKLAHALVQYQDGPKDGALCSKCAQYQAPNACTIVVSPISPNGWCVAYAPKEG